MTKKWIKTLNPRHSRYPGIFGSDASAPLTGAAKLTGGAPLSGGTPLTGGATSSEVVFTDVINVFCCDCGFFEFD